MIIRETSQLLFCNSQNVSCYGIIHYIALCGGLIVLKGFINYKNERIPFVMENYKMELFSLNEELLSEYMAEHNFRPNYILHGVHFRFGTTPQSITMLVKESMANTCYVSCYWINQLGEESQFDSISFQSRLLDGVFRYKYNYIDCVRQGENLSATQKDIYEFPLKIGDDVCKLAYKIGFKEQRGLLEDFEKWGETVIVFPHCNIDIKRCYEIALLMERFAKFMASLSNVVFRKVTLLKAGKPVAHFYCPSISDQPSSDYDVFFHDLDVMKYAPRILENLALDLDNKITQSINVGHIGGAKELYTPSRFVEQMQVFEYLFEKLEPQKGRDFRFPLKKELELMIGQYPDVLKWCQGNASEMAEKIKELRRTIIHGYAYYYDFADDIEVKRCMMLMDNLIRCMNLKVAGFDEEEIIEFEKEVL